MTSDVLLIPGLYDSGPRHWQSLWHAAHPDFHRVAQRDWNTPRRDEWVAALDDHVTRIGGPVVLVAHSLACITVAFWARTHGARTVTGALLVAPSDTETDFFPAGPNGFAPVPLEALPFPSILVASTDDPYLSMERARALATAWGSRLVDAGAAGHINTDAGFGAWAEGEALLAELRGDAR
jgi:hypothetical protein